MREAKIFVATSWPRGVFQKEQGNPCCFRTVATIASGSSQASLRCAPAAARCLHHFVSQPAKAEGIGLLHVLNRVTMQVLVSDHCTMIAAPVQCDLNGMSKRSHYVLLKRADDPSSATRRSGRNDCHHDASDGFTAAHG
jgi:hypothetical protein